MQVTCELIHLSALEIMGDDFDTESTIHRVAKELTEAFSMAELNTVEDFLASLSEIDLVVVVEGEGELVADLYARLGVSVEDQMTIEEVTNAAYEQI